MLRVELLGAHHDRPGFACLVESLDHYLHQQAGQDMRRDLAACYILCEPASHAEPPPRSVPIAGFYTLSMTAIQPSALPEAVARRLGRYDAYPAALLGRLAVDHRFRGQGHGEFLLLDAMHRTVQAAGGIAAHALIVDAVDESAARFYERFEFLRFADAPQRLYLPLATCRAVVAAASLQTQPERG